MEPSRFNVLPSKRQSLFCIYTHIWQNCDRGDEDSVGRAKGKENSCVVALGREQPEGHCSQDRVNEGKVSRQDQMVLSLGFDSEWDRAYLAPKAPSFIPNSGFRKLTHPLRAFCVSPARWAQPHTFDRVGSLHGTLLVLP